MIYLTQTQTATAQDLPGAARTARRTLHTLKPTSVGQLWFLGELCIQLSGPVCLTVPDNDVGQRHLQHLIV